MAGDVVPTVLFYHLEGLGVRDFAGDDQNPSYQTGAKLPNGGDHLPSGHLRAPEIQKDRVKALLLDHGQRLVAIVGNVALASQSRQQDVEDIADGGFVLDDENIAKLGAGVQSILDEAGQRQPGLVGQDSPGACHPPGESGNINAFRNPKVKRYKGRVRVQRRMMRIPDRGRGGFGPAWQGCARGLVGTVFGGGESWSEPSHRACG